MGPEPATVPIPISGAFCGLLGEVALSVNRRLSVCGPKDVGVKVTITVQLEPTDKEAPQVLLEIANCVPVCSPTESPVIVAEPALLRLTVWLDEVVFTA